MVVRLPKRSSAIPPDITVVLDGTTLDHNQVAEDDLAGGVNPVNVGAIPATAIITAYDRLPNGDQLLAFDTTVTLPGGLTVRPGDVVRFNGATYTLEFDATANGIPDGVITDAVSEIGAGDILLSFDVTVAVGGITADDEDLVRVHSGVFSLFFDGSAAGIDPSLDLDAAYILSSNGHLLLAFDGSGTVGGVDFTAEDVLEFTPTTTGWALGYDGLAPLWTDTTRGCDSASSVDLDRRPIVTPYGTQNVNIRGWLADFGWGRSSKPVRVQTPRRFTAGRDGPCRKPTPARFCPLASRRYGRAAFQSSCQPARANTQLAQFRRSRCCHLRHGPRSRSAGGTRSERCASMRRARDSSSQRLVSQRTIDRGR